MRNGVLWSRASRLIRWCLTYSDSGQYSQKYAVLLNPRSYGKWLKYRCIQAVLHSVIRELYWGINNDDNNNNDDDNTTCLVQIIRRCRGACLVRTCGQYAELKKSFESRLKKTATDWLDCTLIGEPFQLDSAATRKARLANSIITLGTVNC